MLSLINPRWRFPNAALEEAALIFCFFLVSCFLPILSRDSLKILPYEKKTLIQTLIACFHPRAVAAACSVAEQADAWTDGKLSSGSTDLPRELGSLCN